MIKWLTREGGVSIEPVEVVSETKEFVTILYPAQWANSKPYKRRRAKQSEWESYHDSWDAAHAHLLEKAKAAVERARERLAYASDKLNRITSMRQPERVEG